MDISVQLEETLEKLGRLLKMGVPQILCDACLEATGLSADAEVPEAEIYCRNCRQMLCDSCCMYHRKAKPCKSHVFIAFENHVHDCDYSLESRGPGVCQKHRDRQHLLNTFCSDCNEALCEACFQENHARHKWLDLMDVSDKFREHILETYSKSLPTEEEVRRIREQLENEIQVSNTLLINLKTDINTWRNELKEYVDRHADSLLNEVESLRIERNSEIETLIENIDKHLVKVDSYKSFSSEITSRGSASDVCLFAVDLKLVANILEALSGELIRREPRSFPVAFTKKEWGEMLKDNCIGKIEGTYAYKVDPTFPPARSSDNMSSDVKPINGLTLFNDEVIVTRYSTSEIEVYDANFKFRRKIRVERKDPFWMFVNFSNKGGLNDPYSIISCSKNNCLYIVDRIEKSTSEIIRVNPITGLIVKKWLTEDNGYGRLSLTDEGNIIQTVHTKSKLIEYTPHGRIVRDIKLSACMQRPWHAIKQQNGNFLVSHGQYGDSVHRVCIVDTNGVILTSFNGGTNSTQLNCPVFLAVNKGGTIMVADANNRRVLLLSSTLQFQRELLTRHEGLKGRPQAICLDESNGMILTTDKYTFLAFYMSNYLSEKPNP